MKRLILLCDGTLMDADSEQDPARYTNIAKLSRALSEMDERSSPPVEQIKLYQSGLGTDDARVGGLVAGALGSGMMQKVKDLYDFICLNWEEGDEIFLFGFSRGAYIVRLLSSFINIVGILSPPLNMHLFPAIFEAHDEHKGVRTSYDSESEDTDAEEADQKVAVEIQKLLQPLSGFRKAQQRRLGGHFLIKCIGVFDTVATRGRPSTFRRASPPDQIKYNSFGLDESSLESCVELAFQALALDERGIDYLPVLWKKVPGGAAERKGQVLRQVWFSGAHSDIGGGYEEQDLSYLTLTWMVSQLAPHLAFDYDYLERIERKTVAPYGGMKPHQSRTGEFRLAAAVDRPFPVQLDPTTNEFLHPSILHQTPPQLRPDLLAYLRSPVSFSLIAPLDDLEVKLQRDWPAPSSTTLSKRATRVGEKKPDEVYSNSEASSTASARPPRSLPVPTAPPRPSSVTSFSDNESPPPSPSAPSAPPPTAPYIPAVASTSAPYVASSPLSSAAEQLHRGHNPFEPLKRAWSRMSLLKP
ncbi:hypothetical protein JCM8097_003846 [Rhodosporidiobolus ruineniae]